LSLQFVGLAGQTGHHATRVVCFGGPVPAKSVPAFSVDNAAANAYNDELTALSKDMYLRA
jgi:hypothetical protein